MLAISVPLSVLPLLSVKLLHAKDLEVLQFACSLLSVGRGEGRLVCSLFDNDAVQLKVSLAPFSVRWAAFPVVSEKRDTEFQMLFPCCGCLMLTS